MYRFAATSRVYLRRLSFQYTYSARLPCASISAVFNPPIDVPYRLGADDTVYTVYRDRRLDFNRIGVMGRVVDRLDHLFLSGSGHKGGLGTVAVAVVLVGRDDVVVNSMGLGAGVRFAPNFGEVAICVVAELGLMPHRINLPYRAVVGGLIIRLPLPCHYCRVRIDDFDLLPLGSVAHPHCYALN